MEISSRKARSQQNHLRLPLLPSPLPSSSAPLPLSSLADIFADDRLVYGQPLPSFPDLEQDISAQWDNGISHHRATDATTTGAVPTRSPPLLLDPSRGWPGTEVSIHLPPSLVIRDAIGHAELAFGQTRVPVRSDTFIDTRSRSSTDEVLRISAYAPSVSHPSSIPVNQQDSSSPSSLVEEKEGYTVEVTLHLLRSKYAVGTFTYLPVNFPIATSRPIAPPPLPCSMQSTSYKELLASSYPTSCFLQQEPDRDHYAPGAEYLHEIPAIITPIPGPYVFPSQSGTYCGAPAPEVVNHVDSAVHLPLVARSARRSITKNTAKAATRAIRHTHTASSGTCTSVALYQPYPNVRHHVDFKLLGDTDRLMDDWSEKEVACGRRIVRFWREPEGGEDDRAEPCRDDEPGRSMVVQCAFEVVDDLEAWQRLQQKYNAFDHPSRASPRRSVLVSCIRSKDEHHVTSVDLIALVEMLTKTRFDIAGKNRIRRNLEGFRPVTASKYSDATFDLFRLIMSFAAPKPRNIEKDIKIFSWRILPYALKKLVIKHYSPPHGCRSPIHTAIPVSSSFHFIPPVNITTEAASASIVAGAAIAGAGRSVARRGTEAQQLLRHQDPVSPETPLTTPTTPNEDPCFVYERPND